MDYLSLTLTTTTRVTLWILANALYFWARHMQYMHTVAL